MVSLSLIKPILLGLLLAGVFGAGWWKGYSGEHEKLITLTAQVEATGKAQNTQTKIADAKNKEQANEADKNIRIATDGIADYYRAHPVVRVRDACPGRSTLPEAADHPGGVDDTPASVDASAYVSPYDPEQVEQIAARLDGLQKLLIKDGVAVE